MHPNMFLNYPTVPEIVQTLKDKKGIHLGKIFPEREYYLNAMIPYIDHTFPKSYRRMTNDLDHDYCQVSVKFYDVMYMVSNNQEVKTYWVIL